MGAIASDANFTETATGAATFTKWLVDAGPQMAGVVGGAVGEGAFAGRVLDMATGPTTTVEAIYGFEGSDRAFKALVHVEQTGLEATVSGVVIDGWGKGSPVRGTYSEIQCEHDGKTTDCWRGRLEILGS